MQAITIDTTIDRLTKRRDQLVTTLRHLNNEQIEVAQNIDWIDQAAYESRVALVDGLSHWYRAEMKQINRALERIKKHEYGTCAACHDPIYANRLEAIPEAEYCGTGEKFRAGFAQSGA